MQYAVEILAVKYIHRLIQQVFRHFDGQVQNCLLTPKFLIGFKHQYRFWAPTLEKARPVRIAAQKKPEPVKADSGF